jgi:hypothetical protein
MNPDNQNTINPSDYDKKLDQHREEEQPWNIPETN